MTPIVSQVKSKTAVIYHLCRSLSHPFLAHIGKPVSRATSSFTMAIGKYSAVPPPPEPLQATATATATAAAAQTLQPQHAYTASGTLDIEAWTISALESLSVSPIATGTGGQPLSIPLDDHNSQRATARVTIAVNEGAAKTIIPPHRPPSRRDSMKRREALLKGKEGSRQRRRWDMGPFLFPLFPSFF